MDLEYLTHRSQRLSLVIALVLSAMIVTLASLIGRGTLNLRGSLFLDVPTPVTVIALTEPKLEKGIHITDVRFLREEKTSVDHTKSNYTYHVQTSDQSDYFARLVFDAPSAKWTLERFEKLHGE